MVILVPWKPVVFAWLLLAAMFWFWGLASFLVEGRNPFLPRGFHMDQAHHSIHTAHHWRYAHKPA